MVNAPVRPTIGPLFGEIAMDLGLLESSALLDALCEQEEQRKHGERVPRIGELLVARGSIGREDVARVMAEVERRTWAIQVPGYRDLEHMSRDESTLLFRAIEKDTEAPVTIRLLRFSLADRPEEIGRFRRESRVLARLEHPNVQRVLAAGDLEGYPYLVLEHVLAPTLRVVLSREETLDEAAAIDAVRRMAGGLEDAHRAGIVHGALSPNCILMSRIGGPKVTGFTLFEGLPGGERTARMRLPHYLSPEQARGQRRPTIQGDVYSLGAILFHMVTGRPPFLGAHRVVLQKHLRRLPPDPRRLVAGLSDGLAVLTGTRLAKSLARRPPDLTDVLARLDALAPVATS